MGTIFPEPYTVGFIITWICYNMVSYNMILHAIQVLLKYISDHTFELTKDSPYSTLGDELCYVYVEYVLKKNDYGWWNWNFLNKYFVTEFVTAEYISKVRKN